LPKEDWGDTGVRLKAAQMETDFSVESFDTANDKMDGDKIENSK